LSKRVAHSQPAHTFCCRTQKPCSIQKRRTGWWIKKSVLNDKCMGTEYMHTHPHHPHAIVHTVHFFEQEPLCSIRLPIHLRVNSSALLPHTEHKSPGLVRLPVHLRVNSSAPLPHAEHKSSGLVRLPIHLWVNSSASLPHTEYKPPGLVRLSIHLRANSSALLPHTKVKGRLLVDALGLARGSQGRGSYGGCPRSFPRNGVLLTGCILLDRT